MKVVAVSQRTQMISEYRELRDAIDQRWCLFLSQCNVLPIFIPNHLETAKKMLGFFSIDGILLTGGNDEFSREVVEQYLLETAIEREMPVLGICHGMQVIQKFFKVNLKSVSGHISENQSIFVNNKLTEVNSYHRFGTKETTSDLIVWAKALDGIVKAIYHRKLPIVGVMWHPERFSFFRESDIKFVKNFFEGLSCVESY